MKRESGCSKKGKRIITEKALQFSRRISKVTCLFFNFPANHSEEEETVGEEEEGKNNEEEEEAVGEVKGGTGSINLSSFLCCLFYLFCVVDQRSQVSSFRLFSLVCCVSCVSWTKEEGGNNKELKTRKKKKPVCVTFDI